MINSHANQDQADGYTVKETVYAERHMRIYLSGFGSYLSWISVETKNGNKRNIHYGEVWITGSWWVNMVKLFPQGDWGQFVTFILMMFCVI